MATAVGEPRASLKFMDVDILAPEDVLKPRAETELLGSRAVDYLRQIGGDRPLRVVDMCCGSGNLAVAIAIHVPDCLIWAADLTDAAVGAARRNVERHGLSDRIDVRQGDLFAALDGDGNGWIDENDAAHAQLLVWMKDARGNDQLTSLAEAGVGALHLGRVDTPFALRDEANTPLGQVRATGIYLKESGNVGTLQQIDIAV